MKMIEIKEQSDEQLIGLLKDLRSDLFNMENDKAATHKVEKPHLFKEKRNDIARILSVMSERKRKGS